MRSVCYPPFAALVVLVVLFRTANGLKCYQFQDGEALAGDGTCPGDGACVIYYMPMSETISKSFTQFQAFCEPPPVGATCERLQKFQDAILASRFKCATCKTVRGMLGWDQSIVLHSISCPSARDELGDTVADIVDACPCVDTDTAACSLESQ